LLHPETGRRDNLGHVRKRAAVRNGSLPDLCGS
jgi:hypothetical protein